MNKQELINKLQELLTTPSETEGFDFDDGYDLGIEQAISLAEDLDEPVRPEPEKPVVPQFVADWYEDNKDDFECNLYDFFLLYHEGLLQRDLDGWFTDNSNKPIETLVMMHKFGYEVKKEKQYVVVIQDDGRNGFIQLCKNKEGNLLFNFEDKIRYGKVHLLTEKEIKQKDERLWQFAEEVNNND